MASFIRAIFGAPQPPEHTATRPPNVEEPHQSMDNTLQWPEPYFGKPVPLDASLEAVDSSNFYYEFREQYYVVPANDETSVLVIPSTFRAESASGEVQYEQSVRGDETDPRSRVETAAQIYEHLTSAGPMHPRLVGYLGRTPSGYRLEKLHPGPAVLDRVAAADSKTALALYQRWALQMLSALSYVHSHGIFLNNVGDEITWMRSDYSLAVASLLDAGCARLNIPGESYGSTLSQWSQTVLADRNPAEAMYNPGSAKGDIFDWAMWVFKLMTGGEDPLTTDLTRSEKGSQIGMEREQAVADGAFDAWPELEERSLAPVLVKAWTGGYESADQALTDVRRYVKAAGLRLKEADGDEIEGHDWEAELELTQDEYGRPVLRIRGDVY